mmetsp:Transcript_3528/g.7794  ORF Transcript_3528/g.7794 Transcript_3528/m.7794 type:complete len:166 (-) Transcript_3528:148-645(-)|eukprot:CAMPEP_0172314914 /NCGR_PEP_ID=MMETSP1058-20130122/23517_1 /TAXON_ID=83371 /ORGANISM="Detonula confervacea, Strain CCMP 353" /LENGTH=165 /DNA_ID=CAMNT_0013028869 /DNA_START=350 /DNA_END=847 /DNA_ORIENTATION=-
MSWSQVYVTGLPRTVDPTDEEIESTLASTYNLTDTAQAILWAGPGTTLVKRDDSAEGQCRGFVFLAFYSNEGAQIAVERINGSTGIVHDGETATMAVTSTLQLKAELCKSKPKSKKGKQGSGADGGSGGDVSDIRLKRQRGAPVRKHPVITSSSGKRTNLGSKTK